MTRRYYVVRITSCPTLCDVMHLLLLYKHLEFQYLKPPNYAVFNLLPIHSRYIRGTSILVQVKSTLHILE